VLAKAGGGCFGIRRPFGGTIQKSLQSGFVSKVSRKDRLQ
jgi:hypothetical protein